MPIRNSGSILPLALFLPQDERRILPTMSHPLNSSCQICGPRTWNPFTTERWSQWSVASSLGAKAMGNRDVTKRAIVSVPPVISRARLICYWHTPRRAHAYQIIVGCQGRGSIARELPSGDTGQPTGLCCLGYQSKSGNYTIKCYDCDQRLCHKKAGLAIIICKYIWISRISICNKTWKFFS